MSDSLSRLVVGLGEVLWDLLPDGPQLGGAPANFAYHAGQFLGMDQVLAVSAVGSGPLAADTATALHAHGLNTLLPHVAYPTGTVEVTLDSQGIPAYHIHEDVAWDHIPFLPEMQRIAGTCRAVCFGTLAQRSADSCRTIRQFLQATPAECLRVFDINLRQHFYNTSIIQQSLDNCNILKINDEELDIVSQLFNLPDAEAELRCRHLLRAYGLQMVILTCGTQGSYVFTAHDTSFLPTPRVEVVDTIGAGDSFTGAFVASLLLGKSIGEAHQTAVRVSAYVCTQPGAMPIMNES